MRVAVLSLLLVVIVGVANGSGGGDRHPPPLVRCDPSSNGITVVDDESCPRSSRPGAPVTCSADNNCAGAADILDGVIVGRHGKCCTVMCKPSFLYHSDCSAGVCTDPAVCSPAEALYDIAVRCPDNNDPPGFYDKVVQRRVPYDCGCVTPPPSP